MKHFGWRPLRIRAFNLVLSRFLAKVEKKYGKTGVLVLGYFWLPHVDSCLFFVCLFFVFCCFCYRCFGVGVLSRSRLTPMTQDKEIGVALSVLFLAC